MRKLRLAVILPIVHVFTCLVIFQWNVLPDREPTDAFRFWLAINGPVLLFIDVAKRVLSSRWISPSLFGMIEGNRGFYLILLGGGLLLWVWVGRTLDNLWWNKPSQAEKPLQKSLVALLVLACGVRLFVDAFGWILPAYPQEQRSISYIGDGLIILCWSLLLMFVAVLKLVQLVRDKSGAAQVKATG